MSSQVIEGTVNFSNVTKTDVFNGQDTGMFSMTITMSDDDAATLAAQGVKIRSTRALNSVSLSPSTPSICTMPKVTGTTGRFLTTPVSV